MYIPTFGLTPNTSYLSATFLDNDGFVVVDDYLQVKGAGPVWAIGDVSAMEGSQYLSANRQASHAVKNIILSISGKPLLAYKAWPCEKQYPVYWLLLLIFRRLRGPPNWKKGGHGLY